MKKRVLSMLLCIAMLMSTVAMLSGCKKDNAGKVDAFVIMTENLDGLFNPFYSTSANDGTIVAMTQISMIGASYENGEISVAYGENEAVAAKDYAIVTNDDGTVSYYFVLKNGIKFSDGHPLTMEDVLFNYYVYLDPVYTGSNTMYSTDIVGLTEYRTQQALSGSGSGDQAINSSASKAAKNRLLELINLFQAEKKKPGVTDISIADMKEIIKNHNDKLSAGYKAAISNNPAEVTYENLLADYEHAMELFKAELTRDYASAQESFTDEPYKSRPEFQNPIFKFMCMEGYVNIEYGKTDGKTDRTKIEKLTASYNEQAIDTMEKAIEHVFNDNITTKLDQVLTYWATAGELETEFTAQAKEVLLHAGMTADGLKIKNISGIVSLGHTDMAGQKITVNGTEYTIASAHDEFGAPTNANEHDILKVTIKGVDPKAIWNFSLTIAPQHYYGDNEQYPVDIVNNKFGVGFASFKFMSDVIQSPKNIKLPMGAGSYKCSDINNSDNPKAEDFYKDNVVYFKANSNFETVGEQINNAKIEKVRYQVVSSNNAINALKEGTVHYISPQMTTLNYSELTKMESSGFKKMSTDQLGYGYIGINAKHVNNMYLRRAIMCAMNTSLAIGYYEAGTASQVMWNMSKVSWAYPKGEDENYNGKDYPQSGSFSEETAVANIQKYMQLAKVAAGDKQLKLTFTIAGSTLQDHPTYAVFRDAAALLNSLGWDVQVVCDTQALTKIATGSLQVWAAAWGSALDPDMYQVYHKDSNATSTKAWGYDYLLTSGSSEERKILDDMAGLIEAARETDDQTVRSELYKNAMGYILDLAVELPVYQRDVLYAYNANVLKAESMPSQDELNPYSSPLDRIWEIEFAAN